MSLDDRQRATLSAVLDTLVPPSPERGLPGAGELGVTDGVADAIAPPGASEGVAAALAALEAGAGERGAEAFAALDPAARAEALGGLDASHPGFVPGLVFQTYAAYYTHPRVVAALGLPPRPPHPEGYEIEPDDWSLLDRVEAGPRRYREPG